MIVLQGVSKVYPGGIKALENVSLDIPEREFSFLVGPSGAGKSTFIKLLIRDEIATSGRVFVNHQDVGRLKRSQIPHFRRKIGVVFQDYKLLPYKTVRENVAFPLQVHGILDWKVIQPRVDSVMELVGLPDCQQRFPDQLSGGEQQRAAIAVALVNEPKVLLADEPTGELDTATAAEVFGALQRANSELGVTVLIVTHDPAVSSVVRRTVAIRDGRTSTEIHRHAVAGDDGEMAQHAVEYAVLDRAGRLQLPREMTEPLGMRDLVRLESEPDHIGVWPDRRATGSGEDQ
jgi:cell division ATP-binding protein FtsE